MIDTSKIADEMSYCGHLKSSHAGLNGHGYCTECHNNPEWDEETDEQIEPCGQFTWYAFVDKDGNTL